jgi:hypothetical protein
MFLNPEDIIYHNQPMLYYRVQIKVLEVEDWHDPSDSSDDDGYDQAPRGSDDPQQSYWLQPWPKKTRFSSVGDGADSSGDPCRLGPQSSSCRGVVVGSILVPVDSPTSPLSGEGGHGVATLALLGGHVAGGPNHNQEPRQMGPTMHQQPLDSRGGHTGYQDLQPAWVPVMSQDRTTTVDNLPSQDPMILEAALQPMEVQQHTVLRAHNLEAGCLEGHAVFCLEGAPLVTSPSLARLQGLGGHLQTTLPDASGLLCVGADVPNPLPRVMLSNQDGPLLLGWSQVVNPPTSSAPQVGPEFTDRA